MGPKRRSRDHVRMMDLRPTSRRRLRIVALCLALLGAARSGHAQPDFLESSQHDLIRLDIAPARSNGSETYDRLVRLCLKDATGSGRIKAFGNRRDAPARHRVPSGGVFCTTLEPTRHVVYFAKSSGQGFQVVLAFPLDLRRRAGAEVLFTWQRDGAD